MVDFDENTTNAEGPELDDVLDTAYFSAQAAGDEDVEDGQQYEDDYFRRISDL